MTTLKSIPELDDVLNDIFAAQALAQVLFEVMDKREDRDSDYSSLRYQAQVIVSKLGDVANDIGILHSSGKMEVAHV